MIWVYLRLAGWTLVSVLGVVAYFYLGSKL